MKRFIFLLTGLMMFVSCSKEIPIIPGYSGIYFISEEINAERQSINSTFTQDAMRKTYLILDLNLENLQDNKSKADNTYLQEAKIFDNGIEVNLIELVQGVEIKITGKKTDIKIGIKEILEKNSHFSIFEYGKYLHIPIYTFRLNDRKCNIEIKAPNINLSTWKAYFVIGTGETGGL